MPTNVISEIAIRIRAITGPFTASLKKASNLVGGFLKTIKKIAVPMMTIFKSIGTAIFDLIAVPFKLLSSVLGKIGLLFTAVAGAGMVLFLKRQFDIIDAAAKTSRALQINIEFLEGMKFAGSQLGVSNEKIIRSLKRFTRTMGEAKIGFGAGATVFKEWRQDIGKFLNMGVEQSFKAIVKELKKIKDPTKQAAIAFQFFGRNAIEMMNIINEGKLTLQEFMDESARLKGAFAQIDANKVEAANDSLDKLKISLGGIAKEMSFILSPVVKFFGDVFTDMIVNAREGLENMRESIEKNIIRVFEMLAPVVIQTGNLIKTVWGGVAKFMEGTGGTGWIQTILDGILSILIDMEFVAKNFKQIWNVLSAHLNVVWKELIKNGLLLVVDGIELYIEMYKKMIEVSRDLYRKFFQWQFDVAKKTAIAIADLYKKAFLGDIVGVAKIIIKAADFAREDILKGVVGNLIADLKELASGASQEDKDRAAAALNKLNAQRMAHAIEREAQVFEKARIATDKLKELFKGDETKADDEKGIEDAISKIKLDPKLALKGSQEAARIALGQRKTDEKIEENTGKIVATVDLIWEALNAALMKQQAAAQIGGVLVDLFGPSATVGAGGVR